MSWYGKKLKSIIENTRPKRSQGEIAAAVGITGSRLSRLLLRDLPDIDLLESVCKELNITLADLFTESAPGYAAIEKSMLQEFRRLSPEAQAALVEFLKRLA